MNELNLTWLLEDYRDLEQLIPDERVGAEILEEDTHSLPQPRTGQKPNYLQQEVLDKAIEDGERRLMERIQKDNQEKA